MSVYHYSSPLDFLTFLNDARQKGFEELQICYYSEIVAEAFDNQQYANNYFNIDNLIEEYEKDPTEF